MLSPFLRRQNIRITRHAINLYVNFLVLLSLFLTSFTGGIVNAQTQRSDFPIVIRTQEKIFSPIELPHPSPRMGARPANNSPLEEDYGGALIQCVGSDYLDHTPGITISQTLSSTGGTDFKILCSGSGCTQQNDVYYRITYTVHWETLYIRSNHLNVYAEAYGVGHFGEDGTGAIYGVPCGPGKYVTCTTSTAGVISGETIHGDPNKNLHFRVYGTGNSGEAYAVHVYVKDVTVSFDPKALNLPFSANCQDCPYGQAQGFVGDPINTRTGGMTFPVDDLSFSTMAGPLTFRRTYISPETDTLTMPLGYGWTHNQDIRLIFFSDPGGMPGFVLFKSPSGNMYQFLDSGYGQYEPVAGLTYSLIKNATTYTLRDQNQNFYTFDLAGKLLTWTNNNGSEIAYTYNQNNRVSRVSADGGTRYMDFQYDGQGYLVAVTDHTGRSVAFSYDVAGNLTESTDVLDQTWQYTYDSDHRLLEVIDPAQEIKVRTEYYTPPDPINFNNYTITNYSSQDGIHTFNIEDNGLTLHLSGNTWKKINFSYPITPNTVMEFDFRSSVQGEVHGLGLDSDNSYQENRTFKLYGTQGWGISTFNDYASSAPNWKHYKIYPYSFYRGKTFDNTQNLIYLFFANDHDVSTPTADSFFSNVRIYESTEPIGKVEKQYNGEGDLVVSLEYNSDGTTTITDALGNQTIHTYDSQGKLIQVTDPLNAETIKEYDSNFRPKIFTDPSGAVTTLTWSADGANLTRIVDAEGNQTDITYDSLNNPVAVIDPRGFLTTYEYDGTNLTSITDALEQTTTYTYTPEGYLESVADPLGNTTSYDYDSHGQRISMTNPLGLTWTYSYNDLGQLVDTTDPLGHVTHHEFDEAGRLTRTMRNYDPARPQNDENQWNIVTEYDYDVRGNQVAVTNTYGGTTLYEFDAADRLVSVTDAMGNASTNTYNDAGQLIAISDPLGHITSFQYEDAGRLIRTTDALGHFTLTSYNPDGTVATATDANGNVTSFAYDDLKRVVSVTNPMGSTSTTYDEAGNVIATTDPMGRFTQYEYDALNRVIRMTDPAGGIAQTFYDEAGRTIQTIDPRNAATTYAFDDAGRQTSVTDMLGNVSSYEYDDLGRRTAVVDALDNRTTYLYDELGRVISVTDPLERVTSTTYDALGNLLSRVDALGHATTYQYDALSRPTAQTNALNGVTSFEYDAVGNRIAVTDPNNHTITIVYDVLNRPVFVTDANENTTTTVYDPVGNIVAVTDALNHSTFFAYNGINQQVSVTDALGHMTQTWHNAAGETIASVDANGVVTRFEYNDLGLLSAVIENYVQNEPADSQTNVRTEYAYDANGNRLSITDGNGHVTTFVYDALNRLTQESDPLGNTWEYAYNEIGERVSMTDANNSTTSYTYDAARQLTGIDYAGGGDVSFAYDDAGRRTSMTDGIGTTSWVYDDINRVTAVTDPFGATVGYAYDPTGNRISLAYPGGQTVAYVYDPANRLIGLSDWNDEITAYLYDDANRLTGMGRPNGIVTAYEYDSANRLLSISHTLGGTEILATYQYAYDDNGNRVQAIEDVRLPESLFAPGMDDSFSNPEFDPPATEPGDTSIPTVTRPPTNTPSPTLTPSATFTPSDTPTSTETSTPTPTSTATPTETPTETLTPTPTSTDTPTPSFTPTPTETLTPTFSPSPTETPIPSGPVTITYAYDPLQRLIAADYSTGEYYHYTYDSVGNRLTEVTHLETTNYVYDSANRLSSVNGVAYTFDANGNLLNDGQNSYAYDSANRLISTSGSAYGYNGLGDRLVQNGISYTLDLNSGLTQILSDGTSAYLYGLGRIAQAGAVTEYFLGDALGSVRQLVDGGGAITLAKSYAPYGEVMYSAGTGQADYGFTGETTDINGLVYLRARYYRPFDGRFLSRDTWRGFHNSPVTQNRWVYANDNPINITDPTGYFPEHCRNKWTKWGYAKCVLDYYHLEPAGSIFFDGDAVKEVKGSAGCWSGPIQYRAMGYVEGYSWFGAVFWGGEEIVYSFATMERSSFSYTGGGINDSVLGGGSAIYSGLVEGLRSDIGLREHYKGKSYVEIGGLDLTIEDFVGLGLGFQQTTSFSDRKLKTMSGYVSLSGGIGLPLFDAGLGITDSTPSQIQNLYGPDNLGTMLIDMITGGYSFYPENIGDHAKSALGRTRQRAVEMLAPYYFYIYQEMYNEKIHSESTSF